MKKGIIFVAIVLLLAVGLLSIINLKDKHKANVEEKFTVVTQELTGEPETKKIIASTANGVTLEGVVETVKEVDGKFEFHITWNKAAGEEIHEFTSVFVSDSSTIGKNQQLDVFSNAKNIEELQQKSGVSLFAEQYNKQNSTVVANQDGDMKEIEKAEPADGKNMKEIEPSEPADNKDMKEVKPSEPVNGTKEDMKEIEPADKKDKEMKEIEPADKKDKDKEMKEIEPADKKDKDKEMKKIEPAKKN